MNRKEKKKTTLNLFILLIFTGIVLYFSLKDNFEEIVSQILTIHPLWFLVGVGLVFAYLFLRSVEICCTIQKFKPNYTFRKAFRLMLVTQFFNAVTPFSSGGQPFQVYTLKKDGLRVTDGTNVIIQNFIVYQVALVILGVMAIAGNYFFHIFKEVGLLKELVTLGFIINTLVVVGLFIIAFARKFNHKITNLGIRILYRFHLIKDKEKQLKKWEESIEQFHHGAKLLMTNKWLFVRSIFLNFVALVCLYLVPVALLYGMGDYHSFDGLLSVVASAYVMLMGSFVPIPGGTGGLEYGFIANFGNFEKDSKLNALMLLWRFLTYYLGMFLGAITLNLKKKEN